MLESAEIGHRVAKDVYAREEPALREALLLAQFGLSRTRRGPVLVIVSGVDGAGRGETANTLTGWMDPRHIQVVAFGERTPEEAVHPGPWRYWQALPPRGRLGIFMHAWYNESMRARLHARIEDERLDAHLQAIREHEQMLSDEGVVLLKFWIHLSKAEQKKRLKAIERDPRLSWRATREDWKAYHAYRKSYPLWETLLRETSTTAAPWYVVEGTDERYRKLTVGRILLDAMHATARSAPPARASAVRHPVTPVAPSAIDNVKLLRDLDLSKKVSARAYPAQLEKWQGALARLSRHKRFGERPLGELRLCAVLIDGTAFKDQQIIVALGLGCDGRKTVLGLREGATENATVVGALLSDLLERGLDFSTPRLYVLDGSKALHTAVRRHAGTTGALFRARTRIGRQKLT